MTQTASAVPSLGQRRRERPEPQRRTVEKRRIDGTVIEEVVLDPEIFGIEPNPAVIHQVVTAQLAAARKGTQSTRTRSEVSGGGAKPFRQKGTGRARQGSIRAPHWAGGGIALGPKPRAYEQRTPKKMVRLALRSALSDRASEGRVVLVDDWTFEEPRTKDALSALGALGIGGQVLLVLGPDDGIADRSFANLRDVRTIQVAELNTYDVVRSDWVVFTESTVPGETEVVSSSGRPARARRTAEDEVAEDEVAGDDAAKDDATQAVKGGAGATTRPTRDDKAEREPVARPSATGEDDQQEEDQ